MKSQFYKEEREAQRSITNQKDTELDRVGIQAHSHRVESRGCQLPWIAASCPEVDSTLYGGQIIYRKETEQIIWRIPCKCSIKG